MNSTKRRPSDQDSTSNDVTDIMNSGSVAVVAGGLGSNSPASNGTQFDVQPPTKRSNTAAENSEIANGVQVS